MGRIHHKCWVVAQTLASHPPTVPTVAHHRTPPPPTKHTPDSCAGQAQQCSSPHTQGLWVTNSLNWTPMVQMCHTASLWHPWASTRWLDFAHSLVQSNFCLFPSHPTDWNVCAVLQDKEQGLPQKNKDSHKTKFYFLFQVNKTNTNIPVKSNLSSNLIQWRRCPVMK